MLTAKLFVPLGAPDLESAGETFWPVQPKLLNTCSSAIFPPGLMSGLVRVMALAAPAPERPAMVKRLRAAKTLMIVSSRMSRRIRRWPPGAWGYSSGAGADASGAGARRMSPLVSRARVEYERGMMETNGH